MADEFVITPSGGLQPKSRVHLIEPDHALDWSEGRLRKLHPSRTVVADFGPIALRPGDRPFMPRAVHYVTGDWIAYATWSNDTGVALASFETTWIVPPPPATQSGQVIFLYNGIQNSTSIFQPVLQWGSNGAFGGNYWVVACWCVTNMADGQLNMFHSTMARVNPGDVLIGVMTLFRRRHGNVPGIDRFSYNIEFRGIHHVGIKEFNCEECTLCCETLEAFRIMACTDYPDTDRTAFTGINIQTCDGTSPLTNPTTIWTPVNQVTDCGQHVVVVSNSSTAGEVDIYYRGD